MAETLAEHLQEQLALWLNLNIPSMPHEKAYIYGKFSEPLWELFNDLKEKEAQIASQDYRGGPG